MWVSAVFWSFVSAEGSAKYIRPICISCKPEFMFWGKIQQILCKKIWPGTAKEDHWPTFWDFVHFGSTPISHSPEPIFYCWHMKIYILKMGINSCIASYIRKCLWSQHTLNFRRDFLWQKFIIPERRYDPYRQHPASLLLNVRGG